jgi:EcsC protein family
MLGKPDLNNQFAETLLNQLIDFGIGGVGILPSAERLAADYLGKSANVDEAIDSLIQWQKIRAGSTGFVTSLGGFALIPVTLPANLAASYILSVNTVAAIACLRGYDVQSHQVRTAVLLCLLGSEAEGLLKNVGIQIGERTFRNLLKSLPGKALREINQKVGFRLLTKTGERGVINLSKLMPVVGGLIGGTIDILFVHSCAKAAKTHFV